MNARLAIIYDPPFSRSPLVIAKINNADLLQQAVTVALDENQAQFSNNNTRHTAWYRQKRLISILNLVLPKVAKVANRGPIM